MRPHGLGRECAGNADVHLTYPAVAGVTGEPPADQLIQRNYDTNTFPCTVVD